MACPLDQAGILKNWVVHAVEAAVLKMASEMPELGQVRLIIKLKNKRSHKRQEGLDASSYGMIVRR